jgi:hypothetical protein
VRSYPDSDRNSDLPARRLSAIRRLRPFSFDHLVGDRQHFIWNGEAEFLGSLEIDHQLELGGLLDGKVARFGSPQYLINKDSQWRANSGTFGP